MARRALSLSIVLVLVGCGGGLSDSELVWCDLNYFEVIRAANRINVHARSLYDELSPADVSSMDPRDVFLTAAEPASDWHTDSDSIRACKAAYEAAH